MQRKGGSMQRRNDGENIWDGSIRWINQFAERVVRRVPLYRSLRDAFRGTVEDFIDWRQAEEIARMVSLSDDPPSPPVDSRIREYFVGISQRSEELVERFTGLIPLEPLGPLLVLDRPSWVRANLSSFRLIFEPLTASYRGMIKKMEEQRPQAMRLGKRLTQGILTVQVGLVMGYLARNVLGQFDLGLPKVEDSGKLYIVYPNLLKAEEKMRLVPGDFRLWITLHEVTHAFEFAAFPWLRDYMRRLMEEYFRSVSVRLEEVNLGIRPTDLRNARRLNEIISRGGLISVIHTPEQREILSRIQAFMSLVEGYSNLVMDKVGKEIIPTYEEMSNAFRRRREMKTGAERFVERVLGFDLKLQQYRMGERFCREVEEKEGPSFLNLAWKREEYLPSYEEILHPPDWIRRIKEAESRRIEHFHL